LDDNEHDDDEDNDGVGPDNVDGVERATENAEEVSTTSTQLADQHDSPVKTRDSQDCGEYCADPILDFEPSYTKANAISFHILCTRLEKCGCNGIAKQIDNRRTMFSFC
jgi:hypothetical protein